MADESLSEDVPAGLPHAWFFFPLPTPLRHPHNWVFRTHRRPTYEQMDAYGPMADLEASVAIHQINSSQSPLTLLSEVMACAKTTVEGNDTAELEINRFEMDLPLTVVEVAVPLRSTEPSTEEISDAFDVALNVTQRLQRVHSALTQSFDEVITMASLPPYVPLAIGNVGIEGVRGPERELTLFHINWSMARLMSNQPSLEEEDLRKFVKAFDLVSTGYAFASYVDLRRELQYQLSLKGNERLTVLFSAMAGEVFLDAMLLHLLWEEEVDPLKAADAMRYPDSDFRDRVRSQFHIRLKGDWRLSGAGPIGTYFRASVEVRNRVVHTGYLPTRAEAQEAADALMGLETYLGDLLAAQAKQKRYMRTAWVFLAKGGFEARGGATKAITALVEDPEQPDWGESFTNWRRHVDRALDPNPSAPGGDPGQVIAYVILKKGEKDPTVILHDEQAHHIAHVDPTNGSAMSEVVGEVIEKIGGVVADQPGSPDPLVARIPTPEPLPSGLVWTPDYLVMSDFRITP